MTVEDLEITRAKRNEIAELVDLRICLLKEIGNIEPEDDISQLKEKLVSYFSSNLASGDFRAWIGRVDGKVVATSGLIVYDVPPHMTNFDGQEAYIMNMYTLSEYRGQGIATKILEEIMDFAERKNIEVLWLRAVKGAERLYQRAGFSGSGKYMEYK